MADRLKIAVAAHKPYRMPQDGLYLPIFVGAALSDNVPDGFRRDDEGENISARNRSFCELTALYWAWKNLDADAVGLVHYRRHFKGKSADGYLAGEEANELLSRYAAILPRKRNYFIETTRSQYVHAHHAVDLDLTREIIAERCPRFLAAFDRTMRSTRGHRFNMFVMRREVFERYSQWLFDILFELERRLDISKYSENDARVFGFVAERLLDPWIETEGVKYAERPVVNLESQHWPRKILRFLLRKVGVRGS